MSQRLRPNFGRSPTLQDILKSYNSAEEALAAGNHYIALLKARTENKRNIEHAALVMCGATKIGLNSLVGDLGWNGRLIGGYFYIISQ